jgi:hypothetical protein
VIWAALGLLRRAPAWVWPALAAGALVAALWAVMGQRDAARAEAAEWQRRHAVAVAQLEQVEEAARVHRAHLDRVEAEAARWRAVAEELQSLEGADAPLSPYLRAVLDRVR